MQNPTNSWAARSAVLIVRLYRNTLSQFMLPSCRFSPSCSQYAEEVLKASGIIRGSWRILGRVLRCHPWGKGGHDPVVTES